MIEVENMSQLISEVRGLHGVPSVNELDSIGLNDMINLRKHSNNFTAALFCNVFVGICLPIDNINKKRIMFRSGDSGHRQFGCAGGEQYKNITVIFANGEVVRRERAVKSTRTIVRTIYEHEDIQF